MNKALSKEEWIDLVKENVKNISKLPNEYVSNDVFMNEVVEIATMYCLDYMKSLTRHNLGKSIVEQNVAKKTVAIAELIKQKFDEIGDAAYIEKTASIDRSQMKNMDLPQKVCLYLSRFKKSSFVKSNKVCLEKVKNDK